MKHLKISVPFKEWNSTHAMISCFATDNYRTSQNTENLLRWVQQSMQVDWQILICFVCLFFKGYFVVFVMIIVCSQKCIHFLGFQLQSTCH